MTWLESLGLAAFVGAVVLCIWVSEDYQATRADFRLECEARGLAAITPDPGRGEWVCVDRK